MTGIIEANVRNAEDPAARKREPGEEPDSSIIPSVAEHASAGVGPSTKVALALAGLVVASALVFMLWRVIFRPLRLDPKPTSPAAADPELHILAGDAEALREHRDSLAFHAAMKAA